MLVILLAAVKSEAQVDSFRVDSFLFYTPRIQDWDLYITKDSICQQNEANLLYRHPVNTKCSYAFIGISIQNINDPEILFSAKNKKNVQTDLGAVSINGLPFFITTSEEIDFHCSNTHLYKNYTYSFSESFRLVIYLESLSRNDEIKLLLSSLDSIVKDFTYINNSTLKKSNSNFNLHFSGIDSSWYDVDFLKYDCPTGWRISQTNKDTNQYIDHRFIKLSKEIPHASIYFIVEHYSELFPPKEMEKTYLDIKPRIITPLVDSAENYSTPFYKNPIIKEKGYFIIQHLNINWFEGDPNSRVRTINSFTIGIVRNEKVTHFINVSLMSSFPTLSRANLYYQLLLQYIYHLESINDFANWGNKTN